MRARLEAELVAEPAELREVAGPLRAEAEVFPDHHDPRLVGAAQHARGELARALRGEGAIEAGHGHADAGRGAFGQRDLAGEGREQGRRFPAEDLGRVRIEGQNDEGEGSLLRKPRGLAEHRPVAAVQAVEVADHDEVLPIHGVLPSQTPVEAQSRARTLALREDSLT